MKEILSRVEDPDARTIAQAPVLVFLLVSAADGTIDKREIRRFESLLRSASYEDLMAVMVRARLSIVDTLRRLTEGQIDYLAELQRIARVLDHWLPESLAQRVKHQLYDLGRSIALSSGQEQEAATDPIGRQEQVALKVIANLIGVDEAEY